MEYSTITSVSGISGIPSVERVSSLTGALAPKTEKADGTLFDSFLNGKCVI